MRSLMNLRTRFEVENGFFPRIVCGAVREVGVNWSVGVKMDNWRVGRILGVM